LEKLAIKLTEDAKLWCDQNGVTYGNFQKMVDFLNGDDIDQKYKELFTHDGNGNGKENNKNKNKNEREETKKKIQIKKYSQNGLGRLHESIIIDKNSKFVYLDEDQNAHFIDEIERVNDILVPADTIDTQNPIPFIFESEGDFQRYLEEAKKLDLETLFDLVESINRKYVDIEDHYHVLLTADMIWTWLQDRFSSTPYNVFTGDNGSGKNSELLVFRFLGYRVYYVVSASAANYYTKMGNIEEGQITIAEDEVGDIAKDRDKRNVFASGYCSGASVPKVELEGGRKSEDWLTYGQKWITMEELLTTHPAMKAILDRSFVFRFVAGDPQYNIKDVIRSAGDPKFKPLHDELMNTRKLLFCWRLLHYEDVILDVKLNVKNRSAELTKPLIRLFQNSPIALGRILDSLSKFLVEKSDIKKNSFESKLYEVIKFLKNERKERLDSRIGADDEIALGELTFTNPALMNVAKEIMDCVEGDKTGLYWSSLIGCSVSQTKITSVAKSKFKAESRSVKLHDDYGSPKTFRCLKFEEKYLKRIGSSYDIPDKIEILKDSDSH
jgi:hypothetical protein